MYMIELDIFKKNIQLVRNNYFFHLTKTIRQKLIRNFS